MKKGKRSYQKPQIKEVKLIPEDAVLANCKATVAASQNSKSGRCQTTAACENRLLGS